MRRTNCAPVTDNSNSVIPFGSPKVSETLAAADEIGSNLFNALGNVREIKNLSVNVDPDIADQIWRLADAIQNAANLALEFLNNNVNMEAVTELVG